MNMKTKSITMLMFGLATTAIASCSTTLHESNLISHESESASHGNHEESHGSAHNGQAGTLQSHATGEGQFPTVGFEERAQVSIPFSVAEVCPLFEPAGRSLLYNWWKPIILREAKGETLKGLIMLAEVSGLEVLLTVTEHTPDAGQIQYIVLWGDFELQRIDITCSEGETADSTNVVWNERNAGIHENGVSMVTTFVEGGNIQTNLERYGQNMAQYLQDQ